MTLDNKKWYIAGVVALAVVVGVVGYSRKSSVPEETLLSPTPPVSASKSPTSGPRSGSAAYSPKTYTDLVKEFNGRRIQFDINCQAIPNNVTFKTGSTLMFDNRSGDARTIKIGDITYQFPGYGYRILTLTSKTLPKTLFLSCGDAVNVGQIFLQK